MTISPLYKPYQDARVISLVKTGSISSLVGKISLQFLNYCVMLARENSIMLTLVNVKSAKMEQVGTLMTKQELAFSVTNLSSNFYKTKNVYIVIGLKITL